MKVSPEVLSKFHYDFCTAICHDSWLGAAETALAAIPNPDLSEEIERLKTQVAILQGTICTLEAKHRAELQLMAEPLTEDERSDWLIYCARTPQGKDDLYSHVVKLRLSKLLPQTSEAEELANELPDILPEDIQAVLDAKARRDKANG